MNQPAYLVQSARIQDAAKIQWRPFVVAAGLFLVCNFVVTWRMAAQYGHGSLFYPPWQWALWIIRYGAHVSGRAAYTLYRPTAEIVAGLIGSLIVARVMIATKNRDVNKGLDEIHGSARFATTKEIQESQLATARDGIFIGGFRPDPKRPGYIEFLRSNSDEHTLTFSPTGSGKTSSVVVCSLLDNPNRSMIVTDPSGEVYRKTAGYRAQHTNVYKFAPMDEKGSSYNIFEEVRVGTPREYSDVASISHTMCHVPGNASPDPHWDDIADELNRALIMHGLYKARNEGRIANGWYISQLLTPLGTKWEPVLHEEGEDKGKPVLRPDGKPERKEVPKTFMDTLQEMLTYEHDPDGTRRNWTVPGPDGNLRPSTTHPVVLEGAKNMLNRVTGTGPTAEFAGALSALKKRYLGYSDEMIQRHTARSDFKIDDLVNGTRPSTLYIVIPLSDENTLQPLLRTMLTVFFNRYSEPEREERLNKWPCEWILEEFPALKRMEIFESRLPKIRKFGHRFHLICQSTEQIIGEYGDHNSIKNNCTIHIASTPMDEKTAAMLESMLGNRTVNTMTESFTGKLDRASKETGTTTIQTVKRPLMDASEILKLPKATKTDDHPPKVTKPGDLLIFRQGEVPIYGCQIFYFFAPEFLRRSQLPAPTEWPTR